MRHPVRIRLPSPFFAALLLSGFMQTAHAAHYDDAAARASTPVGNTASPLGASHCIRLGQRRGSFIMSSVAIPTLSNDCDYPVVVSYCVAASHDARACDSVDAQSAPTRRLEAHQTVAIDDRRTTALGADVNWAGCRALPGVTSSLRDKGTRGYCRAPFQVLQELARKAS